MRLSDRIREADETLLDLIFGCLLYSLLFEIIGLIFVPNKGSYTLGLLIGTAVSVGMSISMARGLERCLAPDAKRVKVTMAFQSILRYLVMFAAAWLGIRFAFVSFAGVLIGLIGLKISAHFHVYTHVYITKRIRKKGR